MNGARARDIRRYAERVCRERGIRDRGGYQPRVVRDRAGKGLRRFPEVRLMPGPRALARHIRRVYTRTGVYPPSGR